MTMIYTVITIERGEGEQLPDGSIDWADEPVTKVGLLVQAQDTWTKKLVHELKFMMSNVIGEVYKVWHAAKNSN